MTPTIPKLNYTFPALSEFPTVGDMNFSEKAKLSCDSMQGLMLTLAAFQPQLNNVAGAIDDAAAWAENKAEIIHADMSIASEKADLAAYYYEKTRTVWTANVAQLAVGTVNDTQVAENIVWSSAKVVSLFDEYRAPPPSVSIDSEVYEGEKIPININGSAPNAQFDVYCKIDGIARKECITKVGDAYFFIAPQIEEAKTALIYIYAYKPGLLKSNDVTLPILVKMLAMVSRAAIVISDFVTLATNSGFVIEAGDLIASIDAAYALTPVNTFDQNIKKAKLVYVTNPKHVEVLSTSTKDVLETSQAVAHGETLILSDGAVTKKISAVLQQSGSTTTQNTLDVFGDQSCKECYGFENSLVGLGGTSVTGGSPAYEDGKYGRSVVLNSNVSLQMDAGYALVRSGEATISFWIKYESGTATDNLIVLYDTNLYIVTSAGKLDFLIKNSAGAFVTISTNMLLDDGNYHNVILHMNANRTYFEILVDNWKSLSQSITALRTTSNASAQVRSDWNGNLDQVRFFNRKLSREEQAKLYEESGSKYVVDISAAGLANKPTSAYRDHPLVKCVFDGAVREPTVESIAKTAAGLEITTAEETIDAATLQFRVEAKHGGDAIKNISCALWE